MWQVDESVTGSVNFLVREARIPQERNPAAGYPPPAAGAHP